ncbi:MAG: hypothetical protein HOL01_07270 [Planctomycetaceae bacterium]|nr:hypothetical protein [Planctomycetaceae bacterium]MBT6494341.1 hypothetical protein [Planctomycetaceae bacterium]
MSNQYELHAAGLGLDDVANLDSFPWQHDEQSDADPPFAVRGADGTVWARLNGESGMLERMDVAFPPLIDPQRVRES